MVSNHKEALHLAIWLSLSTELVSMAVHATLMSTAASRELAVPGTVAGNTRGTEKMGR